MTGAMLVDAHSSAWFDTWVNGLAFAGLIVLFVLFREFFVRRRRSQYERIQNLARPPAYPSPVPRGASHCGRCSSPMAPLASFCARCGAPVTAAASYPAIAPPKPRAAGWLIFLVFGMIALIGLAAVAFLSTSSAMHREPTPPPNRIISPRDW